MPADSTMTDMEIEAKVIGVYEGAEYDKPLYLEADLRNALAKDGVFCEHLSVTDAWEAVILPNGRKEPIRIQLR